MTSNTSLRVALGLSGGVDSAVAAQLLLEAGHQVTAVFIECWREPGCRAETDRQDAIKVAIQLGIPFQALDFRQAYQEKVMAYFLSTYQAGLTPNPDVLCNREIKFGLFYEWAMQQQFDAIATGHYAQILPISPQENILGLFSSSDAHKDQTYFLHQLQQEQLDHILFPIGHLQKTEIRQLAQKYQLPVAQKPDSVGICFVGDINVRHFLQQKLGTKPGEIIDTRGKVVGHHDGLWFYTIGQRHGFAINQKLFFSQQTTQVDKQQLPPLFVIAKKPETNQLVVGLQSEQLRTELTLTDCHWILGSEYQPPTTTWLRIRHTGQLHACTIAPTTAPKTAAAYQITVTKPLSGVSEGQFGVLYSENPNGWQCLGGGVIAL